MANTDIQIDSKSVCDFLAHYFETTSAGVEELFKSQTATLFLMLWSVFEAKLFNGFFLMRKRKFGKTIDEFISESEDVLDVANFEDAANHFYYRYRNYNNEDFFRHLVRKDPNADWFKEILNQKYSSLTSKEKIKMVLYVVYRYRNNIFHGNKPVLAWSQYIKQIDICLKIMIYILSTLRAAIDSPAPL